LALTTARCRADDDGADGDDFHPLILSTRQLVAAGSETT
jgi:hypothetical protein